jgi:hypothetical protein
MHFQVLVQKQKIIHSLNICNKKQIIFKHLKTINIRVDLYLNYLINE